MIETALALLLAIAAAQQQPTPTPARHATVVRIIDGDSIVVDIDVGLNIRLAGQPLRLLGIDAPETRGDSRPAGLAARDALAGRLDIGQTIVIMPHGRGKYGRLLVVIFEGGQNINDWMIDSGHARPYQK